MCVEKSVSNEPSRQQFKSQSSPLGAGELAVALSAADAGKRHVMPLISVISSARRLLAC